MNKCKLFCLPYAGGSSLIFSDWKLTLNPHVEIIPIEFRGRGKRYHENFYDNILEAAFDMIKEMHMHIKDDTPYFFFGQSLGGLIIYEVLTILQNQGSNFPFHVFFRLFFLLISIKSKANFTNYRIGHSLKNCNDGQAYQTLLLKTLKC